jgi:type IV secretory pathway VirB2 component (pilin)
MNILFAIQDLIHSDPLPHAKNNNFLQLGLNITFSIAGAIAILIIVLAGMRLVFARDNPENISKARNSVIYAIIGLIIVASAAAATNLIIVRLGK